MWGTQQAIPFAVQVVKADGVTPVVGEAVTFTTTAGAVQFAACGSAACTLRHQCAGDRVDVDRTGVRGRTIALQAVGVDGAERLVSCADASENGDRSAAGGVCCGGTTCCVEPATQSSDNTGPTTGVTLTGRRSQGDGGVAQTVWRMVGVSLRLWLWWVHLWRGHRPSFPDARGRAYVPPLPRWEWIQLTYAWRR